MLAATATSTAATTTSVSSTAAIEKPSLKQIAIMLARTTLIAVCALMMFAAVHPDTRNMVRTALTNTHRTVISTAQGHLAGDQRVFTVTKVKTAGALSLEIFENFGNGQQKLVEKIQLADARDGYFDFNGHASNLAIDDINGDGRPEILAPTFDTNLVGHLNVYGFDLESNAFQKVIR
jgi:hypothetical protein